MRAVSSSKGYVYQIGQHQIVFGTGLVDKVYEALTDIGSGSEGSAFDDKSDLTLLQRLSRVFGDIFIPIIPAIVVTGLFLGLRGFVVSLGVKIPPEWLAISQVLTDTAFAFLPVFITWSAFKEFGGSASLGILAGLMLISPSLANAWAVASGSAAPLVLSFWGMHFPLVGYQGSIIAPLFVGWLASYVERWSRKVIPDIISLICVPFITIVFVLIVGVILLGPALHIAEHAIGIALSGAVSLPFGIGGLIIGFFNQALVITGLHHIFSFIELSLFNTLGYDPLNGILTGAMAGMVGAAGAIALSRKTAKERTNAIALILPAFFGITEPLLFGLTLLNPLVFLAGMCGGAVAGTFAGILQLHANGLAVTFIPGLTLYLGNPKDLMLYILVILVGIAAGYILGNAALLYQKVKEGRARKA